MQSDQPERGRAVGESARSTGGLPDVPLPLSPAAGGLVNHSGAVANSVGIDGAATAAGPGSVGNAGSVDNAGSTDNPAPTDSPAPTDNPGSPGPGVLIRAQRALVDGAIVPAAVLVRGSRIAAVLPVDAPADGATEHLVDDDRILMPGLVDSHVHVNDPGRADWEGFPTAMRAAAAGGVTTIIDMPLNSIPPTTTLEALALKREAVGVPLVDVGFWGGAIPSSLGKLRPLYDAGVFGVKSFLSPSGVDEFPKLEPEQFAAMMTECAEFDLLAIVHAEDPALLEGRADEPLGHGYGTFLHSRPSIAETSAVARVIDEARRTGARAHILHVSSGDAVDMVRAARAEGVRISAETCPHYLFFDPADIPDSATVFKCCPPIRGGDDRDRLWQAVVDGDIEAIVSDHSPSTRALKDRGDGDFGLAWGGIASLQLAFSASWTAARGRGIPLETVVARHTTGPAELAGVADVGEIRAGNLANLIEFAPDEVRRVDPTALEHRNPLTAYTGSDLFGIVHRTMVRGEVVYDLGVAEHFTGARPGRLITRIARSVAA